MTIREIKNIPEIVDFMLDKSIVAVSRMKLYNRLEEICKLAIKTLEQEPCEDCISREKAIKQCGFGMTSLLIADSLRRLPPVTPQPKIGRWIDIDAIHSKCDRCGAIFEIASENGEANYCPNCGAKMEVN